MGLGFQLERYSRIRVSWRHTKVSQAAPAYSAVAVDAALGSHAIGPQRRWSIWPDTLALLEVKRLHVLLIIARLPWSAWISENCAARSKSLVEPYGGNLNLGKERGSLFGMRSQRSSFCFIIVTSLYSSFKAMK